MAKKTELALWENYESAESYDWVANLEYKLYLPPVVRQLYDFWLYTKIAKHASEDVLIRMQEERKKRGLSNAVQSAISHCRMKRFNAIESQEKYYRDMILNAQCEQIRHNFDVRTGRFEESIKEAERCKNLSDEQRKLREQSYPAREVPLSEFQKQPVIEHKVVGNGVEYKIYEKTFKKYGAVVYSPSRIRPNGTQGVILIQDPDMVELKTMIEEEVEEELVRQAEFDRTQNKTSQSIQTNNRMPKNNVNIDHVKKAMGIDGNRFGNDLDGKIF